MVLSGFLAELKRRKVYRVAVAYLHMPFLLLPFSTISIARRRESPDGA
jgi:hypothetical protein